MTDEESPKKRAKKPRASKLVATKLGTSAVAQPIKTNVILCLKCSLKDLADYTDSIIIPQYPLQPKPMLDFNQHIEQTSGDFRPEAPNGYSDFQNGLLISPTEVDINAAILKDKLKKLKIDLYLKLTNKTAACFWCTEGFNNLPCYIPKYETASLVQVYGSFCCPECALAYLLKEDLDDSVIFERVQLLNKIYKGSNLACDQSITCNIKPALNPYYLLDKYYGNLSIDEYRRLNTTDHSLVFFDKPITRILPELHDDSVSLNQFGSHTGNYRVKRASDVGNHGSLQPSLLSK
jgi:hypothetical protein